MSIFYTSILMAAVIFFAQYKFFSRQVFLSSFFSLLLFLSLLRTLKRLILRRLIAKSFHNINVLIIGAGKIGRIILEEIKKAPWWGFRVVGFLDDEVQGTVDGLPVLGKIKDFSAVVKRNFVEEAVITLSSEKEIISKLIEQAKKMHFGIRMVPENFEESCPVLDISYLGVVPLLTYKERRLPPAQFTLKSFFDFVVSLLLLILLSPIFAIIVILIKLDSDGPIFYVQKRVGFKGKIFDFYKFRSMVKNADELKATLLDRNEVKDGIIFKIRQDPRITRVGRLIRKYSLDELPQLFNVLKGDMGLVGTRPPTPEEVKKYNHDQMQRLSIRPGITGLSQIKGRSELTFRQWIKWDLWYINNWSFGLDLLILWWTIPAVLKGKGAY
jgi:exopolysaccharide biosynthesis polyprenyl glycosylphosphotransferase